MQIHTFEWQIEEFMVYCRFRQLRSRTLTSYEQTLRLFERWCLEAMKLTQVDQVSESVIRRYILEMQERGKYSFYAEEIRKATNCPERRRDYRKAISVCTINNYLRNLKVFFNWLEGEGVLRCNPMAKIKPLKAERTAKAYLADEDFRKLISHMDKSYFSEHRDLVMIHLMLDSGMRLGECSMLPVSALNLSKRNIHIPAELTKGRQSRVVYFSGKMETMLRRWLQFKDRYCESDYLFPTKKTGQCVTVGGFESNFKRYLRQSGLDESITPHCLRNNFAKRSLMNGMNIYTLSRILGHSSVTVTEQAYLDLTEDDIGKCYRSFSPLEAMW